MPQSAPVRPAKGGARILIVDDHPLVREGLAKLIDLEGDLRVVGEAETVAEARKAAEQLKPDLVVLDITLREGNGLDLVRDLRVRCPKTSVLVISMHDETIYAERALKAGARGYLMKDQARGNVIAAIRKVLSGEVYLSLRMSQQILDKMATGGAPGGGSPVDVLSDRELEVFRLLGEGLSTRQVAQQVHRSIRTIDAHRENIKRKLRLSSAAELIKRAVLWVQEEGRSGQGKKS